MEKMSRIERMLDIIDTMIDGKRRTGVELGYKYEVSPSTIYRDISQLSIVYPIVTHYGGRRGGERTFKYEFIKIWTCAKKRDKAFITTSRERS